MSLEGSAYEFCENSAENSSVFDSSNASTSKLEINSIIKTLSPSVVNRKRSLIHDFSCSPKNKISRIDGKSTVLNGSYNEYLLFDRVRKSVDDEEVYQNFLRCLFLYNQNLVTKSELMQLLIPFLGKFPEIVKWLREFLNCNDINGFVEILNKNDVKSQRPPELEAEIDYSSCKRYGVSYRELPKDFVAPKCSGRTTLCNEVLNNFCVSFPSWQSEDSSVVSSKKTQHEECIYRIEDERFELEIVIEVNKAAVQTLEAVFKRMNRMNVGDAKKFQLDELLGGRSQVLQQRAIRRVYGDKAGDIIDGLMRNPFVAVPLVLHRLKSKEKEWKEAQVSFNRIWREQNEISYWKSLEQQANAFKQNDLKLIRPKTLMNQIEILFDERRQSETQNLFPARSGGPLMQLQYPTKDDVRSVFIDVNEILIRYVERQTNVHKSDQSRIKKFLRQTFPSFFNSSVDGLLEEYDEEEKPIELGNNVANNDSKYRISRSVFAGRKNAASKSSNDKNIPTTPVQLKSEIQISNGISKSSNEKQLQQFSSGPRLLYVAESWYVFVRLHHLLVERLSKLKKRADVVELCEKFGVENSGEYIKSRVLPVQTSGNSSYVVLIKQIDNLLNGEIDNCQFEYVLRSLFPSEFYLLFTVDKIVQCCTKQLTVIVNDDLSTKSLRLFRRWRMKQILSLNEKNSKNVEYERNAENLFGQQTCFKTFFCNDGKVSFELLSPVQPMPRETKEETKKAKEFLFSRHWSQFVQSYVKNDENSAELNSISTNFLNPSKMIYLNRNVKKFLKKSKNETTDDGIEAAYKNLVIHEDLRAVLTRKRSRSIYYVAGLTDYFYRKRSLKSCQRAANLRSVETRNRRFWSWHEQWMLEYVSLCQVRATVDWLLNGENLDDQKSTAVVVRRVDESRPDRPPFNVVTRFVSRKIRTT